MLSSISTLDVLSDLKMSRSQYVDGIQTFLLHCKNETGG